MTFSAFHSILIRAVNPVVLLEGKRAISPADAAMARTMATQLAKDYPFARFRSGNAKGADQAFAEGVAAVDASRLQVVAPYRTHRRTARYEQATYDSPESMSRVQEDAIAYRTVSATPRIERIIEKRTVPGRMAAKAAYLIRDTMKVVGHSMTFPRPVFALFLVDLESPESGGTGHTVRVCRQEGVPYAFQDTWRRWIR